MVLVELSGILKAAQAVPLSFAVIHHNVPSIVGFAVNLAVNLRCFFFHNVAVLGTTVGSVHLGLA